MFPLARSLTAALLLTTGSAIGAAWADDGGLTVEMRTINDRKAVFATVESIDVVPARARVGGTVRDLSVTEGSEVAAGAMIARIEDPKLGLELVAVNARIEALGAQVSLARIELERAESLRRSGSGSQARLDDARTNLEVVSRNLAALRAERDVVAERLAEANVLAPTDGRVLAVGVTDGTVVMPGEAIATIARETYLLRMRLPERHARFLAVGDPVLVGARGLGSTGDRDAAPVEGRVRLVYPELDMGRVVADVEVAGLGDYFVGERTMVHVFTGAREAVVVPSDFLTVRFGQTFARLMGGGDVVVVTGRATDGEVEVLSGLRPGDVILPFGTGE